MKFAQEMTLDTLAEATSGLSPLKRWVLVYHADELTLHTCSNSPPGLTVRHKMWKGYSSESLVRTALERLSEMLVRHAGLGAFGSEEEAKASAGDALGHHYDKYQVTCPRYLPLLDVWNWTADLSDGRFQVNVTPWGLGLVRVRMTNHLRDNADSWSEVSRSYDEALRSTRALMARDRETLVRQEAALAKVFGDL